MASETMVVLRTVKGIDCLGRGGIQALGKRLANASPLRRVLKIPRRFRQWKKGPVLLFRVYIGDDILPNYIGDYRIIVKHYKDPYQTTSIMECH